MEMRKTRIVCISDTHNQTPKLPPGDILIHAGDLTNQGSYNELKRTVEWLEKADFEAKIIVAGKTAYMVYRALRPLDFIQFFAASQYLNSIQGSPTTGNHDITFDASFYHSQGITKFKWPESQNPEACRQLLLESPSITYLENSSATLYLTSPTGPQTCLKVFGSPSSPGQRGWAFQYWDDEEAARLWSQIPEDADIVITHTPARGHCDRATKDERTGCTQLAERLAVVRPKMHVCGHIHEARDVERVRWSPPSTNDDHSLVESVEHWTDPGAGNKKISLLNLSSRSGRALQNSTGALPRHVLPSSLKGRLGGQPAHIQDEGPQPSSIPTSSLEDCALDDNNEADEALWRRKAGGAIEARSDVGCGEVDADTLAVAAHARVETAMINAAFLGPRLAGKAMEFNKPVVVDIDLPVWRFANIQQ
jgi:3',5'-cyclic AMP phosphodiesterase CpdA